MPRDGGQRGHDRQPNKYEQPNRYTAGPREAEPVGSPNTLPVPADLPARSDGDWRARRAPEIMVYEPLLGDPSRQRGKAKRLVQDLALATELAQAGSHFYQAAERVEQTRQALELAHARREFVPLQAAQERVRHEQLLINITGGFEAAKEARDTQRTDCARRRQLDDQDFELAMLAREAAKREQEARITAGESHLEFP